MKRETSLENPVFPIFVKFEGGEVEAYDSVKSLCLDLEVFDSDNAEGCEVTDAHGRAVRLRVSDRLDLEELSLVHSPK